MFKKLITGMLIALFVGMMAPTLGEAAGYHDKAIQTAKKNMGVKYKWGGTTTKGFDCSGLVQYSYKKAGKTLPRTAISMKAKGKTVAKNKLKKGDLLFYATGSNTKKITHVAIYLGSGKMIHSASSKGVSTTTLNNSYWKKRYVTAKRI